MNRYFMAGVAVAGCAVLAWAGSDFTNVDSAKYHGKTGLDALTQTLDANFALIESGGANVNVTNLTGGTLPVKVLVNSNNIVNAGIATVDLQADAVTATELADDAVVKASLSAVDYGAFTAGADGTTSMDADGTPETALARNSWGRYDTNDTVSLASYTPRHVCDLLAAKLGGTNVLYYAIGLTTNDWVIVKQP